MAGTRLDTAQDLVELLTAQHEQVKELMPKVLDASGAPREQTFAQVRRMLAVHEALEQVAVHPLAEQQVSPGEADARVQEEQQAEQAIAVLEGLDAASGDFTEKYRALCTDVVEHAEHEQQQEFVHLTGDLSDQARARVALALELLTGQGLSGDSFADMFADAQEQLQRAG